MIAMDMSHIRVITAIIGAAQPSRICEYGFGTGALSHAISDTIRIIGFGHHTIVDNWVDRGGRHPAQSGSYDAVFSMLAIRSWTEFVTKDEGEHLREMEQGEYDAIILDADHNREHEYIPIAFEKLAPGGWLFAHDITNKNYPRMESARKWCEGIGVIFCAPVIGEETNRGLLMVHKKKGDT